MSTRQRDTRFNAYHDFIPWALTARGTGERLVTKDERTVSEFDRS